MTENQYGNLTAQLRTGAGKGTARKLRADGMIPAVIYGKGEGNMLLQVSPRDLRRAMDPLRKLNTFFTVTITTPTGPVVEQCVLTDYQADPIRDEFVHVDFLRVDPESEVVTKVPVEYSGRSVGVVAGGKLRTYQRTARIAAKPALIPVKLIVDVTSLAAGETMRMKDVTIPNARLLEHPNVVVAHVDPPRTAKVVEEKKPAGKKK